MTKPLVVDLFCGLGGWTEGFLAEGYRARGYDIEAHQYGDERYPGDLVVRDVRQMHGSEIADADVIVGSSPCQEYSYMAMPWSRAKAKAEAIRSDRTGEALRRLNALFDAQFRLQRQASEAAGRYIPMVVENVRGAEQWVGRAAWNFGSYYLWGDVPALMPKAERATKVAGFRFDGSGKSFQTASTMRMAGETAAVAEGRKGAGAGAAWFDQNLCQLSSNSPGRKAASAYIAKIPMVLSSHIARVYHP